MDLKAADKKIRKLKRKLKKLRAPVATAGPVISPLAPTAGFPDLPAISGVRFAAAQAGVRYAGRDDVMLVEIAEGSALAGVFTKSATRSAAVLDCQAKLAGLTQQKRLEGKAAILVNSGNANAFTGRNGQDSVAHLTGMVAKIIGCPQAQVFSASTGVIGEPLPHARITAKLDVLQGSLDTGNAAAAARAIMTTDTFAKGAACRVMLDGKSVSIAGFAKGSGMIAPDMATMLAFVFTDAKIAQPLLQQLVSRLTQTTFNSITVDSDTSTSDTVLVVATGAAQAVEITELKSSAGQEFATGMEQVMRDLAHQVVRDGEGATKFIEVAVTGAASDVSARKVALAIANSPLVKTAFAGEDPNWGRVVMAIGKSGEPADRDRISIRFGDILVADKGWVAPDYHEDQGVAYMKVQELKLTVDLGLNAGTAKVWTCDLTHQYISINADYRS